MAFIKPQYKSKIKCISKINKGIPEAEVEWPLQEILICSEQLKETEKTNKKNKKNQAALQ